MWGEQNKGIKLQSSLVWRRVYKMNEVPSSSRSKTMTVKIDEVKIKELRTVDYESWNEKGIERSLFI